MKALRKSRGIALLCFKTSALERGEGSASRHGRFLPPLKTRYPFYRRLGGPQGRSGEVRKISSPPRFDPRTVQPVASRYTDWATRPTMAYGTDHFSWRLCWIVSWVWLNDLTSSAWIIYAKKLYIYQFINDPFNTALSYSDFPCGGI
jgi:hypothetical protein